MANILVHPNPYSFIHPVLGPQGACPQDPHEHANPSVRRFVGARLKARGNGREKVADESLQAYRNMQVTWFEFADEPVEVPLTNYYVDRLRDGSLVPGSVAVAKSVPCRFASIAEARAAACVEFDAAQGAGAFDRLMAATSPTSVPAPAATQPLPGFKKTKSKSGADGGTQGD